jgi:hypothetical protein
VLEGGGSTFDRSVEHDRRGALQRETFRQRVRRSLGHGEHCGKAGCKTALETEQGAVVSPQGDVLVGDAGEVLPGVVDHCALSSVPALDPGCGAEGNRQQPWVVNMDDVGGKTHHLGAVGRAEVTLGGVPQVGAFAVDAAQPGVQIPFEALQPSVDDGLEAAAAPDRGADQPAGCST